MNDYTELLNQIPREAWQYVVAEYDEDDEGNGSLQFFWDPDEHPELNPLNQLDDEQWNHFVQTSLERGLDSYDLDGTADSEPSDRNDGPSGELDQESDS